MKDLKFKAWDKSQKKMVDDFVLCPNGAMHIIEEPVDHAKIREVQKDPWADYALIDGTNWHANMEYELLLYTGCKDKNGKEIYEGDIVKFYTDELNGWKTFEVAVAPWGVDHLNYHGESTVWDLRHSAWAYAATMEVVGNVYENPELLKDKDATS